MSRGARVFACALLMTVGSDSWAETNHAKERGDRAYVNYNRDDQVVGGRRAALYISIRISPQGVGHLDIDPGEIANGWSYGECAGLHLTATPSGEWHWSENGQITVETPTDVTRAVSRDDEWRTIVTGSACSLTLQPEDLADGLFRRSDWNRVTRTVKKK